MKDYYPDYFIQSVKNQIQTKQVWANRIADDKYQGIPKDNCAFTHFLICLPCKLKLCLYFHLQATLWLWGSSVAIR